MAEPCYYFPGNYDQSIWSHETSHRANVFFSQIRRCPKVSFFPGFCVVYSRSQEGKKLKGMFLEGLALQCVFFSHRADDSLGAVWGWHERPEPRHALDF